MYWSHIRWLIILWINANWYWTMSLRNWNSNEYSQHLTVKLYLNLFKLLSYIVLLFICVSVLTLSLITKLQAFRFFTIGFLYIFASLLSVSISWSNILKLIFPERPSTNYFRIIKFIDVLYSTYYLYILLLQHGDIKANPGSPKEKLKNLSCCHWNANSLIAHNVSKISFSEAYNAVYKHDFLWIFETYSDSSVSEGDKNV